MFCCPLLSVCVRTFSNLKADVNGFFHFFSLFFQNPLFTSFDHSIFHQPRAIVKGFFKKSFIGGTLCSIMMQVAQIQLLMKNVGFSLFSAELKWLVHQCFAENRSSIPKGLNHSAQGWPIPRGLPWVAAFQLHNPERVEYQRLTKRIQPFQGRNFPASKPRVARSPAFAALRRGKSQPWAASFNPFGIGKTDGARPNLPWYSTENSGSVAEFVGKSSQRAAA